ncbi:MAG: hypothetical protein D6801_04940 [Alphaproteobacteria bacterium]|nr:MAG: hypothetical protein D6801_04940 [Alphaproteobacteria bacterium]
MELVLHIGAHRTGTTALQQMLAGQGEVLAGAGARALVHGEIETRLPGFAAIANGGDTGPARAALEAEARGMRCLLISEENMIGDMGWNLRSASFYWRARRKLAAYAAFFGRAPARIALGIRSYARYWISAHAKELSYRDVSRSGLVRFADIRDRLAEIERGWCDLVADIREVFPDSRILVCPVEAGLPLEPLAERLVGAPLAGLVAPRERVNAAPEAGLIAAMEEIRAAEPSIGRKAMAARLAKATPRPFAGFSPAQEARMAERYADDLARLAGGFAGVELLAPEEARGA